MRFPKSPERGYLVPDIKRRTNYHIDGMGMNKLCPVTVLCGVALSDQSNEELHRYYSQRIDDENQGENDEGKPDVGKSVQVLLRPGDVVLAHQLLAHRAGLNTSEHIRYQLYYRVPHKEHDKLKDQVIRNPWVEYAI